MVRLTLITALLLTACAADPTIVRVPIVQRAAAPAELLAQIPPPGRIFSLPAASSVACLDPTGRDALVSYVDLLRQRVGAWEAWAAP